MSTEDPRRLRLDARIAILVAVTSILTAVLSTWLGSYLGGASAIKQMNTQAELDRDESVRQFTYVQQRDAYRAFNDETNRSLGVTGTIVFSLFLESLGPGNPQYRQPNEAQWRRMTSRLRDTNSRIQAAGAEVQLVGSCRTRRIVQSMQDEFSAFAGDIYRLASASRRSPNAYQEAARDFFKSPEDNEESGSIDDFLAAARRDLSVEPGEGQGIEPTCPED
jgi:hypothetical protein